MVVNNKVNIVIQAVDKATAPIKKMSGSFSGLKSSMESMIGPIKAVGVGMVGLGGFGLKIAGDFEQTRISFETMLGDADKAKKLLGELSDFAAKTPFEFPEIAQAGKSLLAFGFEAEQIQTNLTRLGDIASGLNIPFTELSDIYGKIRVQGRLYQEDINQLTGRGIPIIGELAKQFGVSESEVKKLVETGQIGFPEIETAFIDLTREGSQFGGMMAKQSTSLNGLLSTAKDNLKTTLMGIIGVNEQGDIAAGSIIDRSKKALDELNKYLEQNSGKIKENAEALIKVLGFVAKVIIGIGKIIYGIGEDIGSALASITIFGGKVKKFFEDLNPQAKQWGINLVKMMSQGILIGGKDLITNAVKEVATTISDYLGFHSPTKKGPASDSDKWMPNFVGMMVEGLNKGKSNFSKAAFELSSVLVQQFGKSGNLNQIQEVLDDLESKFRDSFSGMNTSISEGENNIKNIRSELANLEKQLDSNLEKFRNLETSTSKNIAERVIELEKQLQDQDLSYLEKQEIQKELDFARTKTSIEEIQKLKDYQALNETEKILYNADLKRQEYEEEKIRIEEQINDKTLALQQEEEAVRLLYEQKTAFETEFHNLFKINIEERILKTKESIQLMQKLNEMRAKASENISGQRAVGGTVAGGKTYLVGERGPELFTPSTTGSIIANKNLGTSSGTNININMGGVSVNNSADEDRLVEKIKNELTRTLQLQKYSIS